MYAKIESGQVLFPPHNDGNHFNVHLDPVWLAEHGYTDMTQEEIEALLPSDSTSDPVLEAPHQFYSKLSIRRAMRSLGIEDKLNALLAASETFRNDWTDAQEIDLQDPVLLQALAQGDITEEDLNNIKEVLL